MALLSLPQNYVFSFQASFVGLTQRFHSRSICAKPLKFLPSRSRGTERHCTEGKRSTVRPRNADVNGDRLLVVCARTAQSSLSVILVSALVHR
mmetsp:Transcript_24457/g.45216  ORF Transcript_24457/g.45216 Transcript_24457/m.45216 type:complete len:93 (+) Transcript_24457:267-545(+)